MNDLRIAQKYVSKAKHAKKLGHEFNISLLAFSNMMKRKNCYYTGLELSDEFGSPYARTLDRVDNSKGYVKGNVVVCCCFVNSWKGNIENPKNEVTIEMADKIFSNYRKAINKNKNGTNKTKTRKTIKGVQGKI